MHRVFPAGGQGEEDFLAPTYASRYFREPIPKHDLLEEGMPARAAYQLVKDELNLDGNPTLNLASFVTTWMEPEADQLAVENLNKNLIDQDEYPQSEKLHQRVVAILGRLFNASPEWEPVGTATIGSSEAIILALLAHKRSWRRRREAASQPTDRPNLVVGADVHTCWEKFTNYFEVEARIAPLAEDKLTLSAADVEARVDENTIAVGGLLGTTFSGEMDQLEEINALLADLERERGWHIPLHIDAASGGFIVPFSRPDLAWDFRLSQVRSINVSNHKFGLVYPGMGSVVFRDRSDLPEELVFHINYLGGDMPNYSLNFSRAANTVILQYYNFIRLGRVGYQRIVDNAMAVARYLRGELGKLGFDPIGDGRTFPIIALRAADPEELDVFAVSEELRKSGWIVPAYTLPANADHVAVLRLVVREQLSRDLADCLIEDFSAAVDRARRRPPPPPGADGADGQAVRPQGGKARFQHVC